MSELIVVGFKGTHRAAEVLDQLVELNDSYVIDLKDAVAVYRTKGGELRVDLSVHPTGKEGATVGGLIGALLGALVAAPFTGGASTAAVAALAGSGALTLGTTGAVIGGEETSEQKKIYGISDDYVQQVGGMVQPEHSAVFVLADSVDPDGVTECFHGYGGTILRTTLPAEKAQRLQQVIGDRSVVTR